MSVWLQAVVNKYSHIYFCISAALHSQNSYCASLNLTALFIEWHNKNQLSSSCDGRPFGHNGHGPKNGGLCPPPRAGAEPTFVPSFILIHPIVWPQYTNVTRSTDMTGPAAAISVGDWGGRSGRAPKARVSSALGTRIDRRRRHRGG